MSALRYRVAAKHFTSFLARGLSASFGVPELEADVPIRLTGLDADALAAVILLVFGDGVDNDAIFQPAVAERLAIERVYGKFG